MKLFTYTPMGRVRLSDDPDAYAVTDPTVYRVEIAPGKPDAGRVLGMVQENPSYSNVWMAVAAPGGILPAVDLRQGLWPLKPGRGGWGSKREAAVWLLGASDAQQNSFNRQESGS